MPQKNPMKVACSYDFYVKINFCLYFTHKITIFQFSRACSHYDVIVRSYINGWYLFWYQWKGDVHSYNTLVVNYMIFSNDNPEGALQTSLENMFGILKE